MSSGDHVVSGPLSGRFGVVRQVGLGPRYVLGPYTRLFRGIMLPLSPKITCFFIPSGVSAA